eukprot:gnl/TRDRNA2_/TRDRNA2_155673_c0_seq2.p1 gnl/TRDRNA2_/TRDRNA2_155673_c0~~gnl/TRDRNA2_/TRDRNA2_155673_c0_seq2.p1  ORF type:complete len:240 (+),score=36.63 gnl/TRDRNA2_/TRDRNA2_155673_c0_seq2:171-890(+)
MLDSNFALNGELLRKASSSSHSARCDRKLLVLFSLLLALTFVVVQCSWPVAYGQQLAAQEQAITTVKIQRQQRLSQLHRLPQLPRGLHFMQPMRPLRSAQLVSLSCIPPGSWSSPNWRWGYGVGEAHNVAMRVRDSLCTPESRSAYLEALRSTDNAPPLEETKMVLALAWQRARNRGYDDADWEGAMEDMAACKFEGEDGTERLSEAIRSRLPKTAEPESLDVLAARSLETLQFIKQGL